MVDGNEGDVSAAGVFLLAGHDILCEDFYADFHGGAEDAIHAGLEDDPLADVDGKTEVHIVDGRGYDVAIGVARGGERSGDVDQVHHAAAEHLAQRVSVVWQYSFDDFRTRRAYGFSREAGLGVNRFPVCGPLLRLVRHGEISLIASIRGVWLTAQRPL